MAKRKQPGTDLEPVAGNGLLHRRMFLRGGAVAGVLGAASLAQAEPLAVPEWVTKPGKRPQPYTQPSPFEQGVQRMLPDQNPLYEPGSASGRTPHQFLEGMVTPNGLHFEVTHNGVPEIDPARHLLVIHGLVKRPLKFTVDSLLRYPMTSRLHFIECAGNSASLYGSTAVKGSVQQLHGLLSGAEWTGVPLSVLLDEAGIDPKAKWVYAEGGDASSVTRSIPLAKCMDDVLVALYQNGERLRPNNGYPVRLLVPGFQGNMNIKWLRRLRLTEEPMQTRYETSRYSLLLADGKTAQFKFQLDAKSIITRPSPGYQMQGPGLYEISGLAWSGNGTVKQVEVSADGGKSWAVAALSGPVLPKMLTRFRAPWKWDGGPAVLQSRVTDDTGYVQPTRDALIAARGNKANYHYNGMTSWNVAGGGEVTHVYA
ncbi:MAG: sulfite dehydrogenase [Proteobacteria bacterium]|nr:sulfite dehydrogenase [Pseudomonadota bacterium]